MRPVARHSGGPHGKTSRCAPSSRVTVALLSSRLRRPTGRPRSRRAKSSRPLSAIARRSACGRRQRSCGRRQELIKRARPLSARRPRRRWNFMRCWADPDLSSRAAVASPVTAVTGGHRTDHDPTWRSGPWSSGNWAVLSTWTPALCSPLNGVVAPGHPARAASAGKLNHKPRW